MFAKLKTLLGSKARQPNLFNDIEAAAKETIGKLDFDDADTRIGVSLYFVLSKQFDLIGKREGQFPYVDPFASDKARGALLGTAIGIVRREYGDAPHQAVIDAAVTAFTLAFGKAEGAKLAWQTMDAAQGNDEIIFASDWAIKDTTGATEESSSATPAAYYLAVSGMI